MELFKTLLITFLIICALAAAFSKRLLTVVIIFMTYSVIMSIVWILLQSPDLAVTEAAVGAGVTGILFFVTLRKIDKIKGEQDDEK